MSNVKLNKCEEHFNIGNWKLEIFHSRFLASPSFPIKIPVLYSFRDMLALYI
jgi:hypothetical protein